jgi:hypothetical protein
MRKSFGGNVERSIAKKQSDHLKLEFSTIICLLGEERKRMKAIDFLDMQKT